MRDFSSPFMLITVVSTHLYCFSCLALAASDCFSAASLSSCRATMPCGKTSTTSRENTVIRRPIGLRVIGNLPLCCAQSNRSPAGRASLQSRICCARPFDHFHPLARRHVLEADVRPIPGELDGAEDAPIQCRNAGAPGARRPTPTARSARPPPARPAPRRCRTPRTPAARAPAPGWTAGFPRTAERRPGGGRILIVPIII